MEPLSGMDAMFLYLESPATPQHITLVAVCDPATAPDGAGFEQVRDHIARRLHLVPPLVRKLVSVPWNLHHPHWEADPAIDLDHHIRHAELAAPGTDEQLASFVAQLAAVPLDRSRPLWEMWVVEGLDGGRFALVAKLHHATLDGVAGVEQMVAFFDLEPLGAGAARSADADGPPGEEADRAAAGTTSAAGDHGAEPPPSTIELVTYATVARARSLVTAVPLVARTVGGIRAVRRSRAAPGSDAGGTPLVTPRTPLNEHLTPPRRVAFARLPLDAVKQVKALVPGATVNDVVLTVCAGALRRYLGDRGQLPEDPLLAACPVDVRTEDQRGRTDNRVSAMFTQLPTDVADPLDRLGAAHRAARAAKEEHALFDPDLLQRWMDLADPNVASWLLGLYTRTGTAARHRPPINLVVSNVPGPGFPLYLAGAELVRAYPLGQLIEGVGLNVTVMSYRDGIDLGFLAAGDLVPDVDRLAAAVPDALDELLAAAAT